MVVSKLQHGPGAKSWMRARVLTYSCHAVAHDKSYFAPTAAYLPSVYLCVYSTAYLLLNPESCGRNENSPLVVCAKEQRSTGTGEGNGLCKSPAMICLFVIPTECNQCYVTASLEIPYIPRPSSSTIVIKRIGRISHSSSPQQACLSRPRRCPLPTTGRRPHDHRLPQR